MLVLLLTLTFLFGYLFVQCLAPSISSIEKIGFGILCGFGLQTAFMFLFDLVHIPITYLSIVSTGAIGTCLMFFLCRGSWKEELQNAKTIKFQWGGINFTWLFFFGILIYLVYGIAQKGMYWPVMENDSVVGYDFMAKLIAHEGKIKNNIFEQVTGTLAINRFLYPPLVAGSFALAYLAGAVTSKSITVLFFIALLLSFYGLVKKYTTHTAAILFTCLMAVTPEMFSHAALGLTNLPNAAYVSIAILTFFVYVDKRDKAYFLLSMTIMGFALYSRSDSIVFAFSVLCWLAFEAWGKRHIKPLVIYAASSLGLFIAWNIYVKLVLKANASDFFIHELFWDPQKMGDILDKAYEFILADTQLYGLTFWAFFLLLAVNFKNVREDKTTLLLIMLLSWLGYTFLYYQMDYVLASLEAYMNASYKRGMFCFVPLAWYYVATNKSMERVFFKLDAWLYRS